MSTHTISLAPGSDAPTEVDATVHPCGLLTYQVAPEVDDWTAYRWRIGHHSGLIVAIGATQDDVERGIGILAELTDWTADADTLRAALPDGPPSEVWQRLGEECDVIHPRFR